MIPRAIVLTLLTCAFAACRGSTANEPRTAVHLAPASPDAAPPASFVAPETPDAPFRAHAPALAEAPPGAEVTARTMRLSNGIPVFLLRQRPEGLVRVEIMLRARKQPLGANTMASRGLWLGAGDRNATDDLDFARMTASYALGWIRASVTVPRDHAAAAVGRLVQSVVNAKFAPNEVLRSTRGVMQQRELLDDAPQTIAARVFPMALYGESTREDELSDLRSSDFGVLRRGDTWKAYEDALDPATMQVLVIGNLAEEDVLPLLEPTLGAWQAKGKEPPPTDISPTIATASPGVVVVDRPLSRSLVVLGGEVPALWSADWAPCVALRRLLGGSQGLLTKALAESHLSVAASVNLAVSPSRHRGGLIAEVRTDDVAPTLAAFLRALSQAREWSPPPDVMSNMQRVLVDDEPSWRLTLGGATDMLESLVVHGLPPSDVSARRAKLAVVTPDDVRRVAARYFVPARMKIVIVGDWSKMRGSIEALGLGPTELRDVDGRVQRVEPGAKP